MLWRKKLEFSCIPTHSSFFLVAIPNGYVIFWRRAWHPTLVFMSGESYRRRSLVGYSPQSHKESVTNSCTTEATEHAHAHVILSSAIQTIQKEKKKGKGDFTRCFRVCWVTEVDQPNLPSDRIHINHLGWWTHAYLRLERKWPEPSQMIVSWICYNPGAWVTHTFQHVLSSCFKHWAQGWCCAVSPLLG